MKNIFLFVVILLFGCNGNSDKTTKNPEGQSQVKQPLTEDSSIVCYILENEKDTVSLKMMVDKNQVSGDLLIHYFEKDRNAGTIKGEMKGDTLFATYTFMSEGIKSNRDVVFLKKDDELMQGYAGINPAKGEPDFTDHSAIKFDHKFVLKKSDCQ